MIQFHNLQQFSFLEHGITEIGDEIPAGLVQGEQTHQTGCAWASVDTPTVPELIPGVDVVATKEVGVGVSVRVADCVPILLVDPRRKVVAAVHAGWRGTALQVARKSVEWLRETGGVHAGSLIVSVGPAIGPKDFIVASEVARQFARKYVRESETEEGKFHVDLWQANIDQLVEAGVKLSNIEVIKRSTFSDDRLYSARRGNREERNIAWIRLR